VVISSDFVLDASVTIPWIFRDEKCALADEAWKALVSNTGVAHVPGIWAMEVVNVALLGPKKSDRPKPSKSDRELFFSVVRRMPLRFHHQGLELFLDQAIPLMAMHKKLTSYDAAYVLLAKRIGLPLVTRDELMEKVAISQGVEVLR
jgi:predicted nucleic acid-binding protein